MLETCVHIISWDIQSKPYYNWKYGTNYGFKHTTVEGSCVK